MALTFCHEASLDLHEAFGNCPCQNNRLLAILAEIFRNRTLARISFLQEYVRDPFSGKCAKSGVANDISFLLARLSMVALAGWSNYCLVRPLQGCVATT